LDVEADGTNEALKGFARGSIVVNDEYYGSLLYHPSTPCAVFKDAAPSIARKYQRC
jgi:hypothetical protein